MSPNFSPVPGNKKKNKKTGIFTSQLWESGPSGITISDLQLLLLLGGLEVQPLHRLLGSFPLNDFTSGCKKSEKMVKESMKSAVPPPSFPPPPLPGVLELLLSICDG